MFPKVNCYSIKPVTAAPSQYGLVVGRASIPATIRHHPAIC